MRLRHLIAPAIALLPLVLSACSGHGAHGGAQPAATTETATGLGIDDDDVAFAKDMIGHHQQAVEMADLALSTSAEASPTVRALATRIKAAQSPEIEQMTQWLVGWGQSVALADHDGHDMDKMTGMMTNEEMTQLAGAKGVGFDTLWLSLMIEHHRSAIEQASTAKTTGSDAGVIALADRIITSQQAEIAEIQALLDGQG